MAEYLITFLLMCQNYVCIIKPEPPPAVVVVCIGTVIRELVIHRLDDQNGVPELIIVQSNCTTT